MPYEILAQVGTGSALIIVLVLVLKMQNDKEVKKDTENAKREERTTEKYEQLVSEVMENAKIERENHRKDREMMYGQLDKYNESLRDISECIKVIPAMQRDIETLKKDCECKGV